MNLGDTDSEEDPNCVPRKTKIARAYKGTNHKPEPEKLVLLAPSQGVQNDLVKTGWWNSKVIERAASSRMYFYSNTKVQKSKPHLGADAHKSDFSNDLQASF